MNEVLFEIKPEKMNGWSLESADFINKVILSHLVNKEIAKRASWL
jgi:hypothetical protein